MRKKSRALWIVVLLLAACGTDRGSERNEASDRTAPIPAAPQPDAALPSCPEGASIDPPAAELEGESKTLGGQMNQLRRLMSSYPQSSMLRVKAAKLSLGPPPAGNPVLSQKLLHEALAMHERGCKLPEALEWEAKQSLGLAHMLQNQHADAVTVFTKNAERWPSVAQARFDLACAHCRLNELDHCLAAFVESLRIADEEEPPEFITSEVTAYHFIHQSRQSSDLAPLRLDPRYEETVEPHLKKAKQSRRRGKRRR